MRFVLTGMLLIYAGTVLSQHTFFTEVNCLQIDAIDSIVFSKFIHTKLDSNSYSDSIYYFNDKYGKYKILTTETRYDALCAFSFYPELEHTHIRIKYKSIKGTMNARPLIKNIFLKRNDQRYVVIINNNKGRHKGLPYNSLSFNIKVGWLAHELAHISTYQQMSKWQTVKFSLFYVLSASFKRKTERYTDNIGIHMALLTQCLTG